MKGKAEEAIGKIKGDDREGEARDGGQQQAEQEPVVTGADNAGENAGSNTGENAGQQAGNQIDQTLGDTAQPLSGVALFTICRPG